MSRYLKYTFPAVNEQAVSLIQTLGAGGNLALNGTLVDSTGSEVSFITDGYCRTVSITSANNLGAAVFTITGTQNGVIVTENINGINANTVQGRVSFDVVTSVSVDIAVAAVSVGSGVEGFFKLINIDPDMGGLNYSLTLNSDHNVNGIPTTIYGTNNRNFDGQQYEDITIDNNAFIINQSIITDKQLVFPKAASTGPSLEKPLYSYLLIELDGTVPTKDISMTLIFIQI